jgi:predicted RNA-binding Zn-ribbon protein involved in translation (DUF1610 family)
MTTPSSHSTLITLTCSACSAELHVNNDSSTFACAKCGAEFAVLRTSGVISLQPLAAGLDDIPVHDQRIAAGEVKDIQLVAQLEEDLAAVGEDPGSLLYLAALAMALVGFFALVSGNSANLGIGLFLIVVGLGLFFYAFLRASKLSDQRDVLLARCQQQMCAAQFPIDQNKTQIDALRRDLA